MPDTPENMVPAFDIPEGEPVRPAPVPVQQTPAAEPAPAPQPAPAPAAPAAPAPSAPVDDGGVNRSFWPSFVERLRGLVPPSMYPYFRNEEKTAGVWQHGALTVYVLNNNKLIHGILDKPEVISTMQDLAAETFGGHPNVRILMGNPPAETVSAPPAPAPAPAAAAPSDEAPMGSIDDLVAFGEQFDNIVIK